MSSPLKFCLIWLCLFLCPLSLVAQEGNPNRFQTSLDYLEENLSGVELIYEEGTKPNDEEVRWVILTAGQLRRLLKKRFDVGWSPSLPKGDDFISLLGGIAYVIDSKYEVGWDLSFEGQIRPHTLWFLVSELQKIESEATAQDQFEIILSSTPRTIRVPEPLQGTPTGDELQDYLEDIFPELEIPQLYYLESTGQLADVRASCKLFENIQAGVEVKNNGGRKSRGLSVDFDDYSWHMFSPCSITPLTLKNILRAVSEIRIPFSDDDSFSITMNPSAEYPTGETRRREIQLEKRSY